MAQNKFLWGGQSWALGGGRASRDIVLEVVSPEELLAGVREDLLRLELSAGGALFSGVFSYVLLLWCHSVGTLPVGEPTAEELLVHRGIRVARRMVEVAVTVPLSDGLDPIERRALRDARVLASFLLALSSTGADIGRFEIGVVEVPRCGRFQRGTLPPIRHPLTTNEVLLGRVLACWEENRSKSAHDYPENAPTQALTQALIARRLPPNETTPPPVWGRVLLERFLRAPAVRDLLARAPWGTLEALRGRWGMGQGNVLKKAPLRGFPWILENLLEEIPAAAMGLAEAQGYEALQLERAFERVRAEVFGQTQMHRAAMGLNSLLGASAFSGASAPDTERLLTRTLLSLVLEGAIDVLDAHSEATIERKRVVDAAALESANERNDGTDQEDFGARWDGEKPSGKGGDEEAHFGQDAPHKQNYTQPRPRLWFAADAVLLEWPLAATVLLKAWMERMGDVPAEMEDCSTLITYLAQEGALDERLPARALPIVLDDEELVKQQKARKRALSNAKAQQEEFPEISDEATAQSAIEDNTALCFALALRPSVALFAAGTVAVQKIAQRELERARAFAGTPLKSTGRKKTKSEPKRSAATESTAAKKETKKRTIERLHRSLLMPGVLPLGCGGIGADAASGAGSTASSEDAQTALYLPSSQKTYRKKTVTHFAWRLTVPGRRALREGQRALSPQQETQHRCRVRRVLALFESALNTEPIPESLALFGGRGVFLSVEAMERALLSAVSSQSRDGDVAVRPGHFLPDPERLLESAAAALADWGVLLPAARASDGKGNAQSLIPDGTLVLMAPLERKRQTALGQSAFEAEGRVEVENEARTRATLGVVIAPWCVRPVRVTRFVMDDISRKNVTNASTVWNEEDVPWPWGSWQWARSTHIGA